MPSRPLVIVAVLASILASSGVANAVTIDWVSVGKPGNAADTAGSGAVASTYFSGIGMKQIGR